MFYKHWKKIALALASFFWASCGSDGSSDEVSMFAPEYGVQVMPSDSIGGAVCLYGVEAPVYVEVNNLCYNDTAMNESGKVFKIIDCLDGNKYLRDPSDAGFEGVELPEGVQVFAPKAGSEKAPNCTSDQDICIERNPFKPIEQDSLAGCHPIIDCPAKPDTPSN
ncbi:MAG: hypothetical protein J6P15_05275 [Fibrobacter sp.]|nr:hypothetical protein [Fibrobacter sp.]